ncbi:MAG TPA: NADH-dependent alcohol dehydrogenase [Lactobacillus sp.]|nr:NADH-dependent alcohol dehydrogenase [Lactobacillus sp.]
MENFEFYNPVRVVFGKGSHKEVGQKLAGHAKHVLLLNTGSSYLTTSGLLPDIKQSLTAQGIAFTELTGIVANPHFDKVEEGINLVKQNHIDFLLAVGGGSVIDTAKGIAGGANYTGDVWQDLYEGNVEITSALPLAVVLTIPASGSEVSNPSVITNTEIDHKRTFVSPLMYPQFSIIDPEIFYTLPKKQIAYGIADTTTHIFERYFTQTKHTELIDGLCESAMRTIMQIAPKVLADPTDYDAWSQIGLSATMAHNDVLGMGRQQNWDSHEIEHEVSGLYNIPHGAGMSVIMPAWMTYVYKANPDMFVQFAVNVMGVSLNARDENAVALEGITRLKKFYTNVLGIPTNLRGLGVPDQSQFEKMAKGAVRYQDGQDNTLGQFKPEHWQDVVNIYKLAF